MEEKQIVLCDTDVLIEFYKGNPKVISNLQEIGQEQIAVSLVTVGELLFGGLNKKELHRIKTDLSALRLLHVTPEIGVKFIQLMSDYSLSHKLSLPDGLIAATASSQGILFIPTMSNISNTSKELGCLRRNNSLA
jgi:predicted nucleic acid-binding protein